MKSNVRIIDIAKMAGVSTGTVDRVLHNRGHVSGDKREKVEHVLKEINYQPNMIARFLASNKTYIIKALIPAHQPGEYWELVSKGINKAIEELASFNIYVDYVYYNQDDEDTFGDAITKLEETEYDALIVSPHFKNAVISLSTYLDSIKIPYIYIDSEITEQNNVAYFGANTYLSGSIAAKLMLLEIGNEGNIITVNIKSGEKESKQQSNREKGFAEYLEQNNYKGNLKSITLDIHNINQSVGLFEKLLSDEKTLAGAIVFNSRVHELIKIRDLSKSNIKANLRIIGYDPIDKNIKALKENKISYLISQRPEMQGYSTIKLLGDLFVFGKMGTKKNYMPIDILIKENVDFHNK